MKKTIEVKNLTVRSKKEDKKIIDNLSFDILEGEVVLLKGRNGSGKTTLIKSLIHEDYKKYDISGNIVFVDKINVINLKKDRELMNYRSQIGYVPQNDDYSGHYNLNVSDVILDSINSFKGKKVALKEIEEKLAGFDFDKGENGGLERFTFSSNPNKLSGGQQRILTILSNILSRPGALLYIIDEPLNNLDSKNIPAVVGMIRELHLLFPKSSFLIVTHNEMFNFVDRVIEL